MTRRLCTVPACTAHAADPGWLHRLPVPVDRRSPHGRLGRVPLLMLACVGGGAR